MKSHYQENMIFPEHFNHESKCWTLVESNSTKVEADRLTLLTLNTWFGDYYFEERWQSILKILKTSNADIVALQEMTDASLQILTSDKWIQNNYSISDSVGLTFATYGVVLLSRIPIQQLTLHPLQSLMDRHLLVAKYEINQQPLLIATAHFESLKDSTSIRIEQLGETFSYLNHTDNVVLMGDFNFCVSWEENASIHPTYTDIWNLLHPNERGYTEDTTINLMRQSLNREEKQVRFDRVLLRTQQDYWHPKSIECIGMNPISPKYPEVFPSDHFGLLVDLMWNK